MDKCKKNNMANPDKQDKKMYDDFGAYNIWYLQNFGYNPNWLIKMNWELFRAVLDDDGEEIHRMTQKIVATVRGHKVGLWN